MTIVYNTLNHKMIVASTMIAIIICDPVINEETSDGFTHTKSVSCVLYNHLYKVVPFLHMKCTKISIVYYVINYLINLFINLGSYYWIRFLYNCLGSMAWKSLIFSNTCP